MAYRPDQRDSIDQELRKLRERVGKLEELTSRRVLPSGYIWRVTAGQLEVVNQATNTSTVIL